MKFVRLHEGRLINITMISDIFPNYDNTTNPHRVYLIDKNIVDVDERDLNKIIEAIEATGGLL